MAVPSPDPVATPAQAAEHFAARLAVETDCADVGTTLREAPDSVLLLDVRSPAAFADGHVPGATSLPHAAITREALDALDPGGQRLVVTYCWGPHCNGATRGALAVASAGRAVKEMIGGVWGWQQEGFELVTETDDHDEASA